MGRQAGFGVPRQYGEPEVPPPHPVLLRPGPLRQPLFSPSAVPPPRTAAPPSWPMPAQRADAADPQVALGLVLLFTGLFLLVGAWWLHSARSDTASPAAPSAYARAITSMTWNCTQDAAQLGHMVSADQATEAKEGISESMTSIARHLATVSTANRVRMSCVPEFAAYATLRTGNLLS
jgi:hypothetical protein